MIKLAIELSFHFIYCRQDWYWLYTICTTSTYPSDLFICHSYNFDTVFLCYNLITQGHFPDASEQAWDPGQYNHQVSTDWSVFALCIRKSFTTF